MLNIVKFENWDKRRVLPSILIVISSLLFACSLSYPSEDDGRKAFSERNKGILKVKSFRKTDGKSMEAMGVKMYEMNFEAEVECLTFALTMDGVTCYQKGQTQKVQNSIRFEKSEKGWRAVR
jgi:hypothetical protein